MIFFAIAFSILTLFISLFYRYNNYFMPFIVIAFSNVVFTDNKILSIRFKSRFDWMVFVIPFVFLYIYGYEARIGDTGYKQYQIYYPYTSIFTEKINIHREEIYNYYDSK